MSNDQKPAPGGAETELARLRTEVAQLKQAVTAHAEVDQAIGVICTVGRLGPEQAWDVLVDVSQHTNTKLRTVADHIVEWTCDGSLPHDIDQALRAGIDRQSACDDTSSPA